jgi:indolepyruvate ferredoxin oxidoreductase beta subunit
MKLKKQDVLIVGMGGQGIILASDILGEAAMAAGYDVKKTDTIGMAQRGGSVVSYVRIADKVWSPLIEEGEADILLAFEKLEAARWSYFLRSAGRAIINSQATPPLSVSLGTSQYPGDHQVESILRQRTKRVYFVDGSRRAEDLGDIRTLNMFMLGCASTFLPIEDKVWRDCISQRLPSGILKINLAAFSKGAEEMSSAVIR